MIKSKWLTVHWREGLWVNNDSILVCYSLEAIVWLVIETAFMILFILFWSTDFSHHLLYSNYMENTTWTCAPQMMTEFSFPGELSL